MGSPPKNADRRHPPPRAPRRRPRGRGLSRVFVRRRTVVRAIQPLPRPRAGGADPRPGSAARLLRPVIAHGPGRHRPRGPGAPGGREDPHRFPAIVVARFFAENWPFDGPRPEVYYDPRTIAPDALASLHAKCLVVDNRWSLVSSANFTDRGLPRNLEAGGLIDDPTFASRLSEQWLGLIQSGQMRRPSS